MKPILLALAFGLTSVTGCATIEPEPCSAEWVDWKKDKILNSFAKENRGLIKSFRRLANAKGDINPMQMVSLMQNVKKIERFTDSFTNDVVPELEGAFAQCGQSEQFIPAMAEFLRDEGVSDEALKTIAPILIAAMELRKQTETPDTPGS